MWNFEYVEIAKKAENWLIRRMLPINPVNVVAALDALRLLRDPLDVEKVKMCPHLQADFDYICARCFALVKGKADGITVRKE